MNHVLHQLLLVLSLIPWNELVESLNTSADGHESGVVLHEAVLLLWSNQVLSVVDVGDRNSDVAVVDGLSDCVVQLVHGSELSINHWRGWVLELEWNWSCSEKIVNLSLDFVLGSSSGSEVCDEVLLPWWWHSYRRLLWRGFLWHKELLRSFFRQVSVVVSLYSIFLVFFDLINDRLYLVELDPLGL